MNVSNLSALPGTTERSSRRPVFTEATGFYPLGKVTQLGHRIIEDFILEELFKIMESKLYPHTAKLTTKTCMSSIATSAHLLNPFRDRDSTTAQGSLSQG